MHQRHDVGPLTPPHTHTHKMGRVGGLNTPVWWLSHLLSHYGFRSPDVSIVNICVLVFRFLLWLLSDHCLGLASLSLLLKFESHLISSALCNYITFPSRHVNTTSKSEIFAPGASMPSFSFSVRHGSPPAHLSWIWIWAGIISLRMWLVLVISRLGSCK